MTFLTYSRLWAFFALLYFSSDTLVAQEKSGKEYLSLGLNMNTYSGDLGRYEKWTSSAQGGIILQHSTKWSSLFAAGVGYIIGDDMDFVPISPGIQTNRFFRTTFLSFHYEARYNVLVKRSWEFFLSQGIGVMRYTPRDGQGSILQNQENTRPQGETYGNLTLMLPTGAGAVYTLPNQWQGMVQIYFFNTQTPFLDNIDTAGTRDRNDNILAVKIGFQIPLKN